LLLINEFIEVFAPDVNGGPGRAFGQDLLGLFQLLFEGSGSSRQAIYGVDLYALEQSRVCQLQGSYQNEDLLAIAASEVGYDGDFTGVVRQPLDQVSWENNSRLDV
jgi:hypothetical protein